MKNATDDTGRVLLCSFCKSWFHLVRDCPDRHQSSLHYGEIDDAPTIVKGHTDSTPSHLESLHMDNSIDEYNFNPRTDNLPISKAEDAEHPKFDTF